MSEHSKRAAELGLSELYQDPSIRRTTKFRERLKPSTPSDHELENISWPPERIAEITGVSVRQARAWLKKQPPLLVAFLRLANGDLSGAGAEWHGFRVSKHGLHHPEWKYAFEPSELLGLYVKTSASWNALEKLRDAEERLMMYRVIFGVPSIEVAGCLVQHPDNLHSA